MVENPSKTRWQGKKLETTQLVNLRNLVIPSTLETRPIKKFWSRSKPQSFAMARIDIVEKVSNELELLLDLKRDLRIRSGHWPRATRFMITKINTVDNNKILEGLKPKPKPMDINQQFLWSYGVSTCALCGLHDASEPRAGGSQWEPTTRGGVIVRIDIVDKNASWSETRGRDGWSACAKSQHACDVCGMCMGFSTTDLILQELACWHKKKELFHEIPGFFQKTWNKLPDSLNKSFSVLLRLY